MPSWRSATAPPDVLIVDIDLPGADGRDVCRRLRDRGVATPVLFTPRTRTSPPDRAATAAGGDDYLVKPFMLAELLRARRRPDRARAGRRPSGAARHRDDVGDRRGRPRRPRPPPSSACWPCSPASRGELVERAQLVAAGWPDGATVSDNTLDAYVARIRRKLRAAGAPEALRTRRGVGYELR